jgi:hypothetical protein
MKDTKFERKNEKAIVEAAKQKAKYVYTYPCEVIRLNNHTAIRPASLTDEEVDNLLREHPYMAEYFDVK